MPCRKKRMEKAILTLVCDNCMHGGVHGKQYCHLSLPEVSTPPVIDGRLDDAAWQVAEPIRLVLAETGEPAYRTGPVRSDVLDDTNLYIAFECRGRGRVATYTKHDAPISMKRRRGVRLPDIAT